ncbi:bifunctional adenosylcobinamide kinase/adenosylcobinamide-phosphate guanylyltransferase [Cohnella sp. GCM10027633]|uniref:bifunctional adenosylcobinamide kinase/adenosylcobinamide-phosphate guanylyltransferase n=1 Tax=unclassified Cohnella TaxID=2636738 RepID=UPI00363AF6CF
MLWLITGGIASGKTQFARRLAASVGKEGIRMGCAAFPAPVGDDAGTLDSRASDRSGSAFQWLHAEADASLAAKLRSVNRESNPFLADRRVLVVDSLSGWLRGAIGEARTADAAALESQVAEAFGEVMDELLSYQGRLIVVAEEPAAGLHMDAWTQWYAFRLAGAIRALSERSRAVYRLTAGIATEVKGYRVNREDYEDENLYKNGR